MKSAMILLTKGEVAIVDWGDHQRLTNYRWQVKVDPCGVKYAKRAEGKRTLLMHREILNLSPKDQCVDHINGDGLDNRRINLRVVSSAQNKFNSIRRREWTCRYKGVTPYNDIWRARVFGGHHKHLGIFQTEIEAACAYDVAARALYGEHGTYNFPLPGERSALTGLIEAHAA